MEIIQNNKLNKVYENIPISEFSSVDYIAELVDSEALIIKEISDILQEREPCMIKHRLLLESLAEKQSLYTSKHNPAIKGLYSEVNNMSKIMEKYNNEISFKLNSLRAYNLNKYNEITEQITNLSEYSLKRTCSRLSSYEFVLKHKLLKLSTIFDCNQSTYNNSNNLNLKIEKTYLVNKNSELEKILNAVLLTGKTRKSYVFTRIKDILYSITDCLGSPFTEYIIISLVMLILMITYIINIF